jgi:endoglucanase
MNRDLLFSLLEIPSPSGHEAKAKKFLSRHLEPIGIESFDLGNSGLSWEIGEGERTALFFTHLDQVSLMVERVDDEGYIYVKMPGIDPRIVVSQELTVLGKKALRGVVGMSPPHFVTEEERRQTIPADKLYIDVSMKADEIKEVVRTGDPCVWNQEPKALQGSLVTAAGLDNKASVFLALLLTKELSSRKLPGRIRFFASTQEEVSMFGASFAARNSFSINPSFAVVADVTYGISHGSNEYSFPLGAGPTLGVGPILSRQHLEVIKKKAQTLSIPYTLEPLGRFTGTESDVITLIAEGMPTALVSIPVRYMHTPVEVMDVKDVENASLLLSRVFEDEEIWNL